MYITTGFPELNSTIPLIESFSRYGIDLMEVGMPYSDPMADGPTIQRSNNRALRNGMTLELLFDQVGQVSKKVDTTFILMGYVNQMLQYGEEEFLKECQKSGISGLILPDLPPELYQEQYQDLFREYDVEIIFLITPQTSEQRIWMIDELTDSFIYVVADFSITGNTRSISEKQRLYFQRIKSMNLRNSTLIGFGIFDYDSFHQAVEYSDGAIIASAFINRLEAEYDTRTIDQIVREFVQGIKHGT